MAFPWLSLFPSSYTAVVIRFLFPSGRYCFNFAVGVDIDFAIVIVEVPVFVVLSIFFTYMLLLSWL